MTQDYSFEDLDLSTAAIDDAVQGVTASKQVSALHLAQAAVEPLWPFLAASSTPLEFSHRLALSEPQMASLLAEVGTEGHGTVRDTVLQTLTERFAAIHGERETRKQAEAEREAVAARLRAVQADVGWDSNTPVFTIEQVKAAPAGVRAHIGQGQWATKCPECSEVLTGEQGALNTSFQRHLSGHGINEPMLPRSSAKTAGWIDSARAVVENKGYKSVDESGAEVPEAKGMVLDMTTANMLVKVHDALNEANRAKFEAMPLTKAVDFGWKLLDKAQSKSGSKTAAGPIKWTGETHFGVGFLSGKAANGDIYEVYSNPNMNPTPCSWVNYGPKGDTGPNSGIAEGRGFATMQEAVSDAEAHAAGSAKTAAPETEIGYLGEPDEEGFVTSFGKMRNVRATIRTTNGGEYTATITFCEGSTYPLDSVMDNGHFIGLPGYRVKSIRVEQPKTASMQKGAPFAGYEDFAACVAANSDKDDPEAYCGSIKHKVEDSKKTSAVEALRQAYRVTGQWYETGDGRMSYVVEGVGEADVFPTVPGSPVRPGRWGWGVVLYDDPVHYPYGEADSQDEAMSAALEALHRVPVLASHKSAVQVLAEQGATEEDVLEAEAILSEAAFFHHPGTENAASPYPEVDRLRRERGEENDDDVEERERHKQYWDAHPEEEERHIRQNAERREAVNESAQGTERYQSQPNLTGTHWPDAWEDGKAPQSYLDQGRAAHEPTNPFADRLVTVREAALRMAAEYGPAKPSNLEGYEEGDDWDPQVQQPLTTRPRVIPNEHREPSMVNPPGSDPVPGLDPTVPTVAQLVAARVQRLAARVKVDNPSMSDEEARHIAAQTVATYPEMVKG